jgi:hypothetical protein
MNLLEAAKCVQKAEEDSEALKSDSQWVSLEVNWNARPAPDVALHYGTIHTNGMHERAIATRHYYIQDGEVAYYTAGHP